MSVEKENQLLEKRKVRGQELPKSISYPRGLFFGNVYSIMQSTSSKQLFFVYIPVMHNLGLQIYKLVKRCTVHCLSSLRLQARKRKEEHFLKSRRRYSEAVSSFSTLSNMMGTSQELPYTFQKWRKRVWRNIQKVRATSNGWKRQLLRVRQIISYHSSTHSLEYGTRNNSIYSKRSIALQRTYCRCGERH